MNKDKLHYSPRKLDSYNKTFNFVISERIAGKTTALLGTKIYKAWRHHNRPSIVLRRQAVDITETYILDLETTINEFLPDSQKIKFQFKKGDIKNGIVDITVDDKPFIRFMALSVPKGRLKSLNYPDPYAIFFDEFIIDVRGGEKYLTDEAGKFKELYNTFHRCAEKKGHTLKLYAAGNPYSVYCPLFMWLGVDLALVKPGAFLVGKQYVIECYQIKQELKDHLKKVNPLYNCEDDEYTRYAFGGEAVNDINFNVQTRQPDGYKLRYIFRLQNRYLHVYYRAMNRSDRASTDYGKYWICDKTSYEGSKNVVAIDFNNLVNGTQLATAEIKVIMWRLKECIGNRDVTYSSISAGYLTEALYKIL